MGRLSIVVLFTPELARQQEFYEKSLGLSAAAASARWVQFGTRDAALALRALDAGETPRIELGFDVPSLAEQLALLKSRGAEPEGKLEDSPDCRIARVLDPEGNIVQLIERRKAVPSGRWPRLSHAIVNARMFEACAIFYHDVLGFKMAEEREHWIEFETGTARLTLHASRDADGLPLSPDQRISFALMDDDLDAWADELRTRGVRFATSPTDEEIGRMAEVEDSDGWFVVLRGPEPEVPFEEALAQDYADEDSSRIEQIRKTGEAEAAGRPGFGSRKLTKKKTERVATRGFEALQRASRDENKGGFASGGAGESRGPRGDGPPRPFTPRPDRPPGASSPRPFTPRPDRPPGAGGPRPFTPRPDRPPGSSSPRPFTPRPDRPPGAGGPRPYTPRPDRPPGAAGPRPSPPRREGGPGPRPSGPPRGPRRED
jgi:catechol 2,3-dioxygenase-like lactoylglutathione lyase family enzyme